MISIDTYDTKYDACSVHFIERLKERYDIDISIEDYDKLLYYKNRKYVGKFSKTSDKSIGILKINDTDVWVLYNSKLKLFLTAYPPAIGSDISELIKACFGAHLKNVANELYNLIKTEVENEKNDFDNIKDAAIHYFTNCNYSTLLIEKYKYGGITPIKICNEINKILQGTHLKVSISTKPKL